MKTPETLKEMIEQKVRYLSKHPASSKEYKSAKREYEFLNNCLLLVENNLSDEIIDRMIEKLNSQYQRMRVAYYDEFWNGLSDEAKAEKKRPSLSKFQSKTGAGKIKYQIRTFKFLQL